MGAAAGPIPVDDDKPKPPAGFARDCADLGFVIGGWDETTAGIFGHGAEWAPTAADFGDVTALASATGRRLRPYIRFGNIFITPAGGNSRLRVAAPTAGNWQ